MAQQVAGLDGFVQHADPEPGGVGLDARRDLAGQDDGGVARFRRARISRMASLPTALSRSL